MGELFGIDAVIFIFAAVDGLEVKNMGQDESEVRLVTGISQPIPAEHAFGADGEVVTVRSDEFEEVVEVVMADVGVKENFALAIHEADIHLAGVQVDSAVELSGGSVVFHSCSNSRWPARHLINVSSRGECG